MKKSKWRAYYDLAWTESIITAPEDYAEQTKLFVKVIKENSRIEARTLLHLGCGAQVAMTTPLRDIFKLQVWI